jgi:hypothetical protein
MGERSMMMQQLHVQVQRETSARERSETKDCSPSVKCSTSTHDTDW